MSKKIEMPILKVVEAEDLIKELTAQTPLPGEPLLPLRKALILGELDLRHQVIHKPVDIQNCSFKDKVDLRYCEFKQPVSFSGCTFRQKFDSGNTVYGKHLICTESRFEGPARFDSMQVKASARFDKARFECKNQEEVDFTLASFGHQLNCDNTVFKGPVSFNTVECGDSGFFREARFENKELVDFRYASFQLNLRCDYALFEGPVDAEELKCNRWNCKGTVFEGQVNAKELECNGLGYFRNATFIDMVDFRFGHFGIDLDLRRAYFGKEVRLGQAHILQKLRLNGSCFKERVELYDTTVQIIEVIRYDPDTITAIFTSDQIATLKELKRNRRQQVHNLYANSTRIIKHYKDGAKLLYIKHGNEEALIYGDPLKPLKKSLTDDNWSQPLEDFLNEEGWELLEFQFNRKDILEEDGRRRSDYAINDLLKEMEKVFERESVHERIARYIRLKWRKNNNSRHSSLKDCLRGALLPFKRSVDLTGTKFERFHGGPNKRLAQELARELVKKQDSTKFSSDPYLQLEKYYKNIGDETEATKIHYEGHCALRENAKKYRKNQKKDSSHEEGSVKWSGTRIWVTDLGWKLLTGYGHKAYRLVWPIIILIVVGTAVFWGKDTLAPVDSQNPQEKLKPQWLYKPLYSLDLLVDPVDLGIASNWKAKSADPKDSLSQGDKPGHILRELYSALHVIFGWALIVVFVGWLATFIKKE